MIQRVNYAKVTVSGETTGEIKNGFMVLVGSEKNDNQATVDYLAKKLTKLRVFEDEAGKMNLNLKQVNGSILSISQFTLLADMSHGNRPSFKAAGDPDSAKKMYEAFNDSLTNEGINVETGVFGADMNVELENSGPATFELDYQE